jgi:MFS family permease
VQAAVDIDHALRDTSTTTMTMIGATVDGLPHRGLVHPAPRSGREPADRPTRRSPGPDRTTLRPAAPTTSVESTMSDTPALDRPPTTPPPSAQRGPAGTPQLVLLLAASCLSVLGAVLIAPVLPQMTDAFAGVAGVEILVPMVLTVPALLIALSAPFAGMVADRLGRKRLLLTALVAYAVVGTAPLYLDTLPLILGSRMLLGVCEAAIMTSCTTLIGDYWSGSTRSRYLALQTLVAALSATVFLAVGGAVGSAGWRAPFALYAVAIVLVVPVQRMIWQPAAADQAAPAGERRLESVPWRELLAPCSVTLAAGVVFYALIVQLSFVLDDAGVTSVGLIGGISALMSLATALGSVAFANWSNRTARAILPVEFAIAAVGLAVVSATGSVPVIALGAVLAGFGTGMLLPTLLTWAVNRLHFSQRGRGTGVWTATLFVGQFSSPLIIAGFGAGVGGLRPALAVLAVLTLGMAGASMVVARHHDVPLDVTAD